MSTPIPQVNANEAYAPFHREAKVVIPGGIILLAIGIAGAFGCLNEIRSPQAEMHWMNLVVSSVFALVGVVGGVFVLITFLTDAANGGLHPTVRAVQEHPERYYRYLFANGHRLLDQIGHEGFVPILANLAKSDSERMQDLAIAFKETIERRKRDSEKAQREAKEREAILADLAGTHNHG